MNDALLILLYCEGTIDRNQDQIVTRDRWYAVAKRLTSLYDTARYEAPGVVIFRPKEKQTPCAL